MGSDKPKALTGYTYLVLPEIRLTGGRKTEVRRVAGGAREIVETLDRPDVWREAKRWHNACYYTLEQTCCATTLGYFTDGAGYNELLAEGEQLSVWAAKVRKMAAVAKSDISLSLGLYAVEVQNTLGGIPERLNEIVLEHLQELLEILQAGAGSAQANPRDYQRGQRASKNLIKLVEGPQKNLVRAALATYNVQRKVLTKLARQGLKVSEAVAQLNLEPLLTAIAYFESLLAEKKKSA